MEGVVYVREEAESDDGVETEAEAEAEAAVVKREEAPAGKRATRKARTAAAAAPASTPPAAAAATPAPAAAPAADKTPPVKRGRGRPRKVAAVAAVAAAAAPPPASKKRKASDALAPASTPAVAVFAENNNINNNTNENNNSDDDDDELSFYLRMAEAATGSGPHLDAPQPLLSRPAQARPGGGSVAAQIQAIETDGPGTGETVLGSERPEPKQQGAAATAQQAQRKKLQRAEKGDQVAAANAERDMYKALVDELQSKLGGLKLESTDTIMEESESTAPASSSTAAPSSSSSASASATTTKPAAKPKECRPTRGQTPVNSLTAWLHDQHISNHSLPHHFDEIDVPKRIGNLAYSKVELPIQPPQQLSVPRFVSAESVDDDVDTLCGEEETDMIALVPVAEPVEAPVASGEDDDDDDESLQGDEGTDVDPLTQLLESLDVGRLSPTSNDFTLMRLLDRKL
ncbi:hypothetical protein BDR26DRAFT_899407 [Obelidium mucronatum]|nr:hypothetical protein BDR26DRAFT_899407 [Obelidium mucronatum]